MTETATPLTEATKLIAAGFDLASIEDVISAEVQLKRNGSPLPIFVTIAGPEHPNRKAFAFAKQRKMRQQLAKTGKVEFTDPVEDEQEETDLLAACLLGWRDANGNTALLVGGNYLDCTRDNAHKLLTDPKRAWFRRAVRAAFDDNEAFIVASVTG